MTAPKKTPTRRRRPSHASAIREHMKFYTLHTKAASEVQGSKAKSGHAEAARVHFDQAILHAHAAIAR